MIIYKMIQKCINIDNLKLSKSHADLSRLNGCTGLNLSYTHPSERYISLYF